MNRILLIVLALVALTVADETTNASKEKDVFCAPSTPCMWALYKETNKDDIYYKVFNTYCKCKPEQKCVEFEDDTTTNSYVYKCVDDKS